MKQRTGKKLLTFLLTLAMVVGLMPGVSLTAYATETLLTTITATAKEQANYSTANVATVSFSYTAGGSSAYFAKWGWWGYGWTATVNAAEGYTITKCVFYDDANRTATDSEAPFVVETTEEDKTPQVNGTPILANTSKGIKKIEVYGYATPAHTHSFTYAADGATITATCSDTSCALHSSPATLTLSATDTTYTGSAYTGASLTDTTAWTGAGLTASTIEYAGRGSTSYTKSSTAPTNAGTYTASITVDTDKTATADFTINPMALTITGATATNRTYDKDSTAVTISAVTFKDSSQQAVALTVGEDKDYTVTGAMSDANAGDGKTVNVTVTLKNTNYSLATNTTTATVNIGKADAQTIADMTDTLLYTATSVSESVAGKMPDDAGTLTYSAGSASKTGSVTVSNFDVNATSGAVTATLSGGAAGDTVTLPVTISSTNYADSTVNVKITLTAKTDAGVTISGMPTQAKTYGDADFTLTSNVTNEGTGTGNWTWSTSDETVFQITPNGATATVKILKAGSATVTAKYESDTTIDTETTAVITVNTKTLRITAKDQSIYVGGTVPTLSGSDFYTVTGLVGEDALTTAPVLAYQKDNSSATPDNTTAGTYDIVASGASAGDNYAISYTKGTLTISEKQPATVTKAPAAKTLTYNGEAQELVTAGEATGGTMYYAVTTENTAPTDDNLYTTSIPAKTDAGTYYVWYKAVGDANHTNSEAKCITVTIGRRSSGGGGGSSSGGSSSSPSTPTTPTESYTVPVSSENTVNVTTNISNGTAVVSEITQSDIDKIVNDGNNSGSGDNTGASENTSITIDVSQAKSEVTSVQLSEKTMEKLTEAVKADNNVESVEIKMTNATIELDGTALSAVSEQAEGSSIKLVVKDTQTTKLNATQQESLKQFASAKPFQAYFESNGKEIHDFKGGKATVSIKFSPESGRDVKHYHMYYLPVKGAIERYVTRYAGGMLSFVTTHFSDYAIVYDETMENETGKDTGTGDGSSETGDGANTNADGTVTGDNSESGNVDAEDESQTDTLSDSTANGKTAYQNAISINKGLKVSQTGNKLNISWGKVSGADRYEVYAAYCGKKFGKNPVKIVTGAGVTTAVIKKLDGKKLNLKKNFKVYVVAYKTVSGKKQKLGKTIVAHVVGRKNAAYTNIKAIKLEKSKATIKKGKTWRIKATVVLVDSSKKMLPESHASAFRYASSNKKIATVNKNGKVKAKKKGTCYIWIYAKNGYAKKIKVTVQ